MVRQGFRAAALALSVVLMLVGGSGWAAASEVGEVPADVPIDVLQNLDLDDAKVSYEDERLICYTVLNPGTLCVYVMSGGYYVGVAWCWSWSSCYPGYRTLVAVCQRPSPQWLEACLELGPRAK